ncbi:MAG: cell division protein FtsZ [Deltaproteobacteria bacterium]|nr:cell division protein FtsZ [Deltaproteobacteria bacterium]
MGVILPDDKKPFIPQIKVVGAGGGGGNVVSRLNRQGIQGVELIACNTDLQALKGTLVPRQVLLGPATTRGQGAGANPEVGRKSALESERELTEVLQGAQLVFLAVGLGGGTGTGSAPVVASAARQLGALTVGMVTLPFSFEGRRRMASALAGLEELRPKVDVLLVIPNDRLLALAPKNLSMVKAFEMADKVLGDAICGLSDLITLVGLINVDFSDVRTILENKGGAVMGRGSASGPDRLVRAAQAAIQNPLMGNADIRGAKGILAHVMGNEELSLLEVNEVMDSISREAGENVNLIFGATTHPSMGDEVSLMMIVTGLEASPDQTPGWRVNGRM